MVHSCVSPDGTFVVSGSENGMPYIWNTATNELHTEEYNCKFIDPITDITWNPKYNMIACSGFGH